MADWVHCNVCFRQPGDGKKFLLTSCGHIYCDKCISGDRCQMCRAACTTMPLSSKMRADVELFFTDPVHIIKKQEKQLVQVIDFQKNHRQRLTVYFREKLLKQNQLISNAQEAFQKTQDLEREIIVLKQENVYLRRLISVGSSPKRTSPKTNSGGSPPGNRQPTPGRARKTPVNPTTYPTAVPHYPKSPDSSLSPSVQRSQSMIRQGRITVRTPPSDGMIGPIVGSPSAELMHAKSTCNATASSPMACSPSQSYFLKLHAGDTPNNPLKPTTPGTPAALAMFKSIGQAQQHNVGTERKPIQLTYNPCSSMSARVQGLGQTGKHKVCIQNIKKLKHDNSILLDQTIKLKKNLQRLVVKEAADRTKFDAAREEISVLRKMLDTETDKEQKLKEVYHQLEQLQNERKELQDEKAKLTEALALKEEDFVQLQLKFDESAAKLNRSQEMCAALSEKTEALETENGCLEKRIEQLLQENAEQSKRIIALQEDGFQLENNVDEHKDDQHSIKDEAKMDTGRKNRVTPVRRSTPFTPKVPKTPNIRMTPRIGSKTPGRSVVILRPSNSGGVKRSLTAVLQTSGEDTDSESEYPIISPWKVMEKQHSSTHSPAEGGFFKFSPRKVSTDDYNWSVSCGNANEQTKEFRFRPHSRNKYSAKAKRKRKMLGNDK